MVIALRTRNDIIKVGLRNTADQRAISSPTGGRPFVGVEVGICRRDGKVNLAADDFCALVAVEGERGGCRLAARLVDKQCGAAVGLVFQAVDELMEQVLCQIPQT